MHTRTSVGPIQSDHLLERDDALASVADAVARALARDPQVVLVTGAAGVGKTSLLQAARRHAEEAGLWTLSAVGGDMEQDHPFAVVSQLLWRAAPELDAVSSAALSGRLESGSGGDPYVVLDALYWDLVTLAERGPLLVVVDDAHWADPESLRWLTFVVRRSGGLPLALVVATRPPGLERPLLAELACQPQTRRVELRPLTAEGTAELLQGARPDGLSDAVLARCHAVTDGNPFYVNVLAWALGQDPEQVPSALVDLSAPLTGAVRDAVLSRLRALGPEAVAVARAVVVLGADATPDLVAGVADLPPPAVGEALRKVLGADILLPGPPLQFRHPLVSDAVYGDLGTDAARLHGKAARVLEGHAAELERIALHLVRTEASDDLWVVETLAAAAHAALRRGAPDTAVRCLRRALDEPLARHSAELVLTLGTAELLAGDPASPLHLKEAVALAGDGPFLEAAALAYARSCTFAGLLPDAVATLQTARLRLVTRDPAAASRLDVETAIDGVLDLATLDASDEALARCAAEPGAHDDPLVLSVLCMQPARAGATAGEAARLARRALSVGGGALQAEAPGGALPALALLLADEIAEATAALTRAAEDARRRGSVSGAAQATTWRAHANLRAGDVVGAGADAAAGLAAMDAANVRVLRPYGVAFLSDALVERGELDEAEVLWSDIGLDGDLPLVLPASYLLFSRGSLHLARGRNAAAVRDLLESGRRQRAWGYEPVPWWPYASRAALALSALGQHERALELAEEEVAAARRWEGARALGMALRARALLARGADRVARLEEAAEVLDRSPDALEHARTQADLGAALLRAGRRTGVPLLEGALGTASDCGATALAQRAQAELAAAGVRSTAGQRGVDALTLAERRVAELAAEGRTNREIAQALYVTPKTVETHMARVLRKLRVPSRRELPHVQGVLRS